MKENMEEMEKEEEQENVALLEKVLSKNAVLEKALSKIVVKDCSFKESRIEAKGCITKELSPKLIPAE